VWIPPGGKIYQLGQIFAWFHFGYISDDLNIVSQTLRTEVMNGIKVFACKGMVLLEAVNRCNQIIGKHGISIGNFIGCGGKVE
jgi:hypothetical protein